jgi:hypothetical protein
MYLCGHLFIPCYLYADQIQHLLIESKIPYKYNHAQLQTQENAWMNEMKSLQDKYTRNKTRKLTVLETHKRSSISTNECLTSHNNSETVCDNNNCDKSSTISHFVHPCIFLCL